MWYNGNELVIDVTKEFNGDVMFPMDIYKIDVYLRPEPIKSKTMDKETIYESVKELFMLDDERSQIELCDGWTMTFIYDKDQPDFQMFYGVMMERGDDAFVETIEMVTHSFSDAMESNVIDLISNAIIEDLKEYE